MFKRNWKTSLLGLVPIALIVLKSLTGIEVHIPGMTGGETIGLLVGGGLLAAKDGNKRDEE